MSLTRSRTRQRGLMIQTATRIEPIDARAFVGGAAVSADGAYLVWFRVDFPFRATAMEYLCSTASGNVDLGIFSTADFSAFTLLGSTGATAAAGSNAMQSINLSAAVDLAPGIDYYAAIVGPSGSLQIGRIAPFAAAMGAGKLAYAKSSLNPLANIASGAVSGTRPCATIWGPDA